MENLKIYNKKQNVILRKFKKVLTIATLCFALTACDKTKNNTTPQEPTGIEYITPTNEATPTNVVDPTVTSTPEPTVTPTPTPSPYRNIKVSVDDIMMYDNVVGDFFGEKESFDKEFEKRCEYLKSFEKEGVSDEDIRLTVAIFNEMKYNRKYSRLIGDATANKYFSYITIENIKRAAEVCGIYMMHNVENPDDQIVFSWLAIDGISMGLEERIILNEIQKVMCEVAKGHTFNLTKINITDYNQTRKYWIKTSDGERIEVAIDTDYLNNVCKYFICAMQDEVLNKAAENTDNKDIINAKNNILKHLDTTDDALLNLERLIETTNGLSGKYYYNVYYDPNSDDYQTWNPYYDMVIPDQETIEEKAKVK